MKGIHVALHENCSIYSLPTILMTRNVLTAATVNITDCCNVTPHRLVQFDVFLVWHIEILSLGLS
jgi:hypothetical protein